VKFITIFLCIYTVKFVFDIMIIELQKAFFFRERLFRKLIYSDLWKFRYFINPFPKSCFLTKKQKLVFERAATGGVQMEANIRHALPLALLEMGLWISTFLHYFNVVGSCCFY